MASAIFYILSHQILICVLDIFAQIHYDKIRIKN